MSVGDDVPTEDDVAWWHGNQNDEAWCYGERYHEAIFKEAMCLAWQLTWAISIEIQLMVMWRYNLSLTSKSIVGDQSLGGQYMSGKQDIIIKTIFKLNMDGSI